MDHLMNRPRLNIWAAAGLAAACVPFSVLPMAEPNLNPELWHLTPFFAVGLLLGCGMVTWRAVAAVVAVRLVADLGIWWVSGRFDWAFYGLSQPVNYLALVAAPLIGRFVAARNPASVLAAAVAAPVAFFVVSNFGVWLGGQFADPAVWGAPQSLMTKYELGLPFLRNSLIATPLWCGVLFAPPVLAAISDGGRAGEAALGA